MNKIIKLSLIFFLILIMSTFFMFVFKLCPPQGPWERPPWCVSEVSYEYKELSYIKEAFEPTDMKFEMGIAPFDIWGNPHLWIDLGDVTTRNMDHTTKRMSDIGADIVMYTDFVMFAGSGNIIIPTPKDSPGTYNMKQDEMNDLVKKTKDNGIEKIMLMVNLVEIAEDIKGIEASLEEDEKIGESLAIEVVKKQAKDQGLFVSPKEIKDYDEDTKRLFFDQWKSKILFEAKKAETAGFTHILINPRHVTLENIYDPKETDELYLDIFNEVKKVFSGKVGLWQGLEKLEQMSTDHYDFIVIEFNPNSFYKDKEIFKDVGKDADDMKERWDTYLKQDYFKKLPEERYLLTVISSIKDGLSRGWIDPRYHLDDALVDYKVQALGHEALFRSIYDNNQGLDGFISYGYWWNDRIYPETKVLRNDLMHTIRRKDAEHVFYKWSKVFS